MLGLWILDSPVTVLWIGLEDISIYIYIQYIYIYVYLPFKKKKTLKNLLVPWNSFDKKVRVQVAEPKKSSGIVRGNSATKTRHPKKDFWDGGFLKVLTHGLEQAFLFQLQVVPSSEKGLVFGKDMENENGKM